MNEILRLTKHLINEQIDPLEQLIIIRLYKSEDSMSPKQITDYYQERNNYKVSRRLRKMESRGYVISTGLTQDRKYTLTGMGVIIAECMGND